MGDINGQENKTFAIVLHGGAGVIDKSIDEESKQKYLAGLRDALEIGKNLLIQGRTALDAVEATVKALEDNPLFNAGKGAVFAENGSHELDASIMDGSNLACGAVGGVSSIKNPISLARLVMEKTPHVLLIGPGAEKFADEVGAEKVEQSYFYTEKRYNQWQIAMREDKVMLDHSDPSKSEDGQQKKEISEKSPEHSEVNVNKEKRTGTVGAVALDYYGNLAAATSTGGTTNKRVGRVGDSPVIGAGTYAKNSTCAISATGVGEEFVRHVVAYDISAIMEYKEVSLQEAAETVVHKKLSPGDGGIIGVDAKGNTAMVYNSKGMFRAMANSQGEFLVKIWE